MRYLLLTLLAGCTSPQEINKGRIILIEKEECSVYLRAKSKKGFNVKCKF